MVYIYNIVVVISVFRNCVRASGDHRVSKSSASRATESLSTFPTTSAIRSTTNRQVSGRSLILHRIDSDVGSLYSKYRKHKSVAADLGNSQHMSLAADLGNSQHMSVAADLGNSQLMSVAADLGNSQHMSVAVDLGNRQHMSMAADLRNS